MLTERERGTVGGRASEGGRMAVAGTIGPRSGGKGGDWWDGTGWLHPSWMGMV